MGYYNLAKLALTQLICAENCENAEEWHDLGRQWSEKATALVENLIDPRHSGPRMLYFLANCYHMRAEIASTGAAACLQSVEDPLDQRREAIALFQKSREILQSLAEKNPDVPEYQLALAEISIAITHVLFDQGQLHAALDSIDRAEAILTPLAADCGEMARYRTDFTNTWSFIGMYHADPLRRNKALETLQNWQQYLEQAAAQVQGAEGAQEALKRTRRAIEKIKQSQQNHRE